MYKYTRGLRVSIPATRRFAPPTPKEMGIELSTKKYSFVFVFSLDN